MKINHRAIMRLHILYFVLIVFMPFSGYSQDIGSCAEKLKTAQSLFERGQVGQVPSMLSECMKSGFTREESLTAYKLLIQSYLFEDKLEKADSTMMAFLKKNPEYQISPTDHSSFVNLFNKFLVKPVLQLTLHIGTNVPYLTLINTKTVSPFPGTSNYSVKALNIYASVEAKFELTKKIELNFEPAYSQLAFSNIKPIINLDLNNPVTIYNSNTSETQKRIELPVTMTYNFKNFGKFTPYGRFGLGAALSIGSSESVSAVPTDIKISSHTGPDIIRNDSRISMDMFSQIGGGVKFKIKGGYFVAELRTNLGFRNQTIRGKAVVPEEELNFNYYNEDDDFHLNAANFTLGYTRIFYKPSKRKE